jgi:hypothetical protein
MSDGHPPADAGRRRRGQPTRQDGGPLCTSGCTQRSIIVGQTLRELDNSKKRGVLLGRDALDTFRQIHEAQRAEVDAWQKLTSSTDFED